MAFPTRKISSYIAIGNNDIVREALGAASYKDIDKKVLSELFKNAFNADNTEIINVLYEFFSGHADFISCLNKVAIDMIPHTRNIDSAVAIINIYKDTVDENKFDNYINTLLYQCIITGCNDRYTHGVYISGTHSLVKMAIECGADVNKLVNDIYTSSLTTAFITAVRLNDITSAQIIADSVGFDSSQHQSQSDKESVLALMLEANSMEGFGFSKTKKMQRPTLLPEDVRLIKTFLEKGGDPNFFLKNKAGSSPSTITPLSLAATNNDFESFMILLQAGADPLIQNENCRQLEQIAAAAGNVDIVKELEKRTGKTILEKNITTKDRGLIKALKENSVEDVKKALLTGANVNFIDKPNKNKISAFTYAAAYNADPEIFQMLFDAGLDPNLKDKFGHTAFNILSSLLFQHSRAPRSNEIIKYNDVLFADSHLDNMEVDGLAGFIRTLNKVSEIIDITIDAGCEMKNSSNLHDSNGLNKLDGSYIYNNPILSYVISSGIPFAILNAVDYEFNRKCSYKWNYKSQLTNNSQTVSCFNPDNNKRVDTLVASIFKKMLANGLDPNMKPESHQNCQNRSIGIFQENTSNLLLGAVFSGMPQTTGVLLEAGADPDLTNKNGLNALSAVVPDCMTNSRLIALSTNQTHPANVKKIGEYILKTTIETTDLLINAGATPVFSNQLETIAYHQLETIAYQNKDTYSKSPGLREFVLDLENYAFYKPHLEREDAKEAVLTGFEFDI